MIFCLHVCRTLNSYGIYVSRPLYETYLLTSYSLLRTSLNFVCAGIFRGQFNWILTVIYKYVKVSDQFNNRRLTQYADNACD